VYLMVVSIVSSHGIAQIQERTTWAIVLSSLRTSKRYEVL
jgi:hypothetical protein